MTNKSLTLANGGLGIAVFFSLGFFIGALPAFVIAVLVHCAFFPDKDR